MVSLRLPKKKKALVMQKEGLKAGMNMIQNALWRKANRFTSLIPPPPFGGVSAHIAPPFTLNKFSVLHRHF